MLSSISVVIADNESAIRNGLSTIINNIDIINEIAIKINVLGCAENGKAALELIRKFHPDIAIIDISMPDLSGLDVIKTSIEENITTRFLILSGYENFEYAQRAIRYGVKSYFLKPLNLAEFREIFIAQCRNILEAHHADALISSGHISSLVDSSRTLLLNQLIQNRFPKNGDISDELTVLHLSIKNTNSCVVLFSAFLNPEEEISLYEIPSPDRIVGLLEGFPNESWVYTENQIVSLVNVEDIESDIFKGSIHRSIQLLSHSGYPVKAGIGSPIKHLTKAHLSYSSALDALSYRIYDTGTLIFDSNTIDRQRPSFSAANIDYDPLIYAVTHQSANQIKEYIDNFFTSLFAVKTPPPNYVLGMCIYLLVNLQKQLWRRYPDAKQVFEFSYDKLYQFDSIRQLRQWITEILTDYSRLLASNASDQDDIIHVAKEYIQNNLGKNIKAKDVARQVHLSESYFTIYFKNKTGINFRDYLLNARMTLAQRLLASKDANISEIAYQIGYQDYRSFSRAFKNETGMSPSEYMNSL